MRGHFYLVCVCVCVFVRACMRTFLIFCVSLCDCVSAHYLWSRAGSIKQITPLLPIFQHITSSRAWWEPIMKGPALAKSRVSTAQTLSIHPALHFPLHSPHWLDLQPSSPSYMLPFIPRGVSSFTPPPQSHTCVSYFLSLRLLHQLEWPNLSLVLPLMPPHCPLSTAPLVLSQTICTRGSMAESETDYT